MPYATHSAFQSYSPDVQARFITELSRRGYRFARRLGELNLRLSQQLAQDATAASRQLISCTHPVEWLITAIRSSQPMLDHLHVYQQECAGLLTATLPSAWTAEYPASAQHRDGAADTGASPPGPASRAASAAGAAGFTYMH